MRGEYSIFANRMAPGKICPFGTGEGAGRDALSGGYLDSAGPNA
ncbi:hypothetical protein HMPREF1508_0117 [Shuttleworthella sp. MSX8B]|nr:hypothetical protein HMPREF1508_0117 [Shuttleworthia sp. MSX8B]